ncbi:hypothetical protein CALCODRAFT_496239 [Calocera cornea HHB12733]|uniref:Uncharacterized protein n=1 Tax=Calocera cornea HHB12733 TaxID=1353952 RepID=A0A165FZY3_9BASI|nr:hypothetical protein CALCODRAFT_496239 [Calocera cornea HHB12733]
MPAAVAGTHDTVDSPPELIKSLPAFRPLELLDFEEVRLLADRTRRDLFTAHQGLAQLIQWHGRTIAARVSKRSRDKRKALFHTVNPYLQPTRPHVLECQGDEKTGSPLQLLNYDDLASGSHFVSLLATRGLHPLADWAVFDLDEVSAASTFFAVNSLIRITGRDEYYGTTFQAQGLEARKLQEQLEAVPFGVGMQLLSQQNELLMFLTNVVIELLKDTDLAQRPSDMQPLTFGEILSTEALALGERSSLRPYTFPPRFSIEPVMQALLARLSAAADDVWLLRTDWLHFRTRIQQIARCMSPPNSSAKDSFWDDACHILVMDAYRSLLVWTSAFEAMHVLQASLVRKASRSDENSTAEISFHLACLELIIEEALSIALASLSRVTQSRDTSAAPNTALRLSSTTENLDIMDAIGRLCRLGLGGSSRSRHHLLLAIDEVFLRDGNQVQSSKIVMGTAGALSSVSTANNVLMALRHNRPQHHRLDPIQRRLQYSRLLGSVAQIESAWKGGNDLPTHDLTRGCQNFDTVPSRLSSSRGGKVATAMLQSLWQAVDTHFIREMGTSLLELTKGGVGFSETQEASIQAEHDSLPFTATLLLSAKKRILNFFAFLFSETEEGDELQWTFEDFKLGMRQLGFRVEHVMASEYRFTPTSDSCFPEFPLSVHQPLPHGHFSWTERRSLAKRLRKHYGLTRRLFNLSTELHAKLHSVPSSSSVSTEGL